MPSVVETAAPSDATGAAPPPDEDVVDLQTSTVSGKKKKKSKAFAARGPTALPKNRGTGFEGLSCATLLRSRSKREKGGKPQWQCCLSFLVGMHKHAAKMLN